MSAAVAAVVLGMSIVAGQAVPIMQVGTLDGRPDEFALAPDGWGRWAGTFPADVRFQAGVDDAAQAFPFIHPGPVDAWAGFVPHTFTIDFTLADVPSGPCLLIVGLCRSHYAFPPRFTVRINDAAPQTFPTARDGTIQKMFYIVPPGVLRAGANSLTIENAEGSWFQYDGLVLYAYADGQIPEQIDSLVVEDTVFFKQDGDALRQVLHVHVSGLWDGVGTLTTRVGDLQQELDARSLDSHDGVLDIGIEPVTKETEVTVELVTSQGARVAASCVARPHRQWQIFVALKTHYDLGYTEPVDAMLDRSAGPMLDLIQQYCDQGRAYAPGHRFTWTYPTWMIDAIRQRQTEAGRSRLDGYIARDEITWHALPFTLHSYFCGLEDIARSLYGARELDQQYGKTTAWAKQTDVPGHTRFFPQILTRSGVRLLQIGANNGVRGVRTPLLFWWESPDGSRVLTQLTDGYGWGWSPNRLAQLENDPAYPYDAFLALYVTGDNVGPENLLTVATEAEQLGQRYAYPRIQIGHVEAFTDWISTHAAAQVPVLTTELNDWWIHGVASQAEATAVARHARECLTWSERLHALAQLWHVLPADGYPAAQFHAGYLQSLLYSEHTWGIAGFKPQARPAAEDDLARNPAYDPMKLSWRLKGDFARQADEIARETLSAALTPLAEAAAPHAGGLVVHNPAGWARTDIVRVAAAEYPQVCAFEPCEGGERATVQRQGTDLVFIARDVPALGYRVYTPVTGEPTETSTTQPEAIETQFYRAQLDAHGEVTSIVYKPDSVELLDPDAPGLFNQYLYDTFSKVEGVNWHESGYGGPGTGRVHPTTLTWRVDDGPLAVQLTVEGTLRLPDFPVQIGEVDRIIRTTTFWKALDRIDCQVQLLGKKETAMVEAGHVAFPFGFAEPQFALEQLGSITNPATDVQEAGNRDTFAIQHWAHVGNSAGGVTWATVQAPLVSVGDIRIFRWDPDYVPTRAHIYSSVLNNGWSTNFQEFQGGDFTFQYALRGHGPASGPDPRFGWDAVTPLLPIVVREGRATLPPSASLLSVAPENVVLVNLKRAEDGDGWIVRLYETLGRRVTARLEWGQQAPQSAVVTRLTEAPWPDAPTAPAIAGRTLETVLGPYEIQTMRVRF